MMDTIAMFMVGIGLLLCSTSVFAMLIDVAIEVYTGEDLIPSSKKQSVISVMALSGVALTMVGCVLHAIDLVIS